MNEIKFEPSAKQWEIFERFDDDKTFEIIYGGSAGSGKSYILASLIIIKCLQNSGIRVGLGRRLIKDLKESFLTSFYEVLGNWGITEKISYNSTAGKITFDNGSVVVFVGLDDSPSDPNFNRLGGNLFTFIIIDEIGEISYEAYNAFLMRAGRWKNKEYNIKPMLIASCNPTKGWLYNEFYKKTMDGTIEEHKLFIQALPEDNPKIPEFYIANLMRRPFAERQRLLYGNWEYDELPNALIESEAIISLWSNVDEVSKLNKRKYLSCDIAFTSDRMVLLYWEGMVIKEVIVNPGKGEKDFKIEEYILRLCRDRNISLTNVAYDSDGVGDFLRGRLISCKAIKGNSGVIGKENYANLKTQLYFSLSEKINNGSIKIDVEDYKNEFSQELSTVCYKPSNDVGKIEMENKKFMKKILGRSPDFADAMAYRMVFELKDTNLKSFVFM